MTAYRRNLVAGGTFFFTVNLADRRSRLLVERIAALRESFRAARLCHPFINDAIVILPDHLHAIWTLPPDDSDYATRWNLIKGSFSRAVPPGDPISPSRSARRERGIWQRRYWEHTIRDHDDFVCHIEYIHFNPVKHGYVMDVAAWPHSSFHAFVRRGAYPASWGAVTADSAGSFGER